MSIEPTRPSFDPSPPPPAVRAARAAMDDALLEMGADPADALPREARGTPEIGTRTGEVRRPSGGSARLPSAAPRVVRGEQDHGPEFRTPTDRARVALLAGDPEAALAALDTRTAGDLLDPEARAAAQSPVTQGLRAQARLDQGDAAAALDAATRGLADAPRSLALRWTAAQAATALGAPDAAAALLAPLVDAADAAVTAAARANGAMHDSAPPPGAGAATPHGAGSTGASRGGSTSPTGDGATGVRDGAGAGPAGASAGSAKLAAPVLARDAATAPAAPPSRNESMALTRRDDAPTTADARARDADVPSGALAERTARHVARHRPGARAYAVASALESATPDPSSGERADVSPARVPATTRAALLRLAGGLVAHLGDGPGVDGVALFARDAAKRLDGGVGIGELVREPGETPGAAPADAPSGGTDAADQPEGARTAGERAGASPRASGAVTTVDPGQHAREPDPPRAAPSSTAGVPNAQSSASAGAHAARIAPEASSRDAMAGAPDAARSTSQVAPAPSSAAGASAITPPRTTLPEPYAAPAADLQAPALWRGDRVVASGSAAAADAPAAPPAPAAVPPASAPAAGPAATTLPIVPVDIDAVLEPPSPAPLGTAERDALLAGLPEGVRRAAQDGSAALQLEESVRRVVGLPARREPDEPARASSPSSPPSAERATSTAAGPEPARARPDPFASLAPGDRSAPHFVAWLAADLASGALPLPPQAPPPIEVFEHASDPAGVTARATAAMMASAPAARLPVTWRGVLRAGVVGAGLVLLIGGRPVLGTAVVATAVWWWLGDARRAARQATWSTRPTIE